MKQLRFKYSLALTLIISVLNLFPCVFAEDSEIGKNEESTFSLLNSEEPVPLKGYVSKIPGGTKLRIILETPIDEETSMIDDEISARISEDIVIDGKIVIPAASTVTGKISEINPAKRMHKAGSVRIEFKNVLVPDGRQIPITASVLTRSGLVKGKYSKKTVLTSTATLVAPAAAGLGAGLAAEGSALGAAVGAGLGAIAGISLFAFQRGNMVDIKAGDEMNIELIEEAFIPEISKQKNVGLENNDTDNILNEALYGDSNTFETEVIDTKNKFGFEELFNEGEKDESKSSLELPK